MHTKHINLLPMNTIIQHILDAIYCTCKMYVCTICFRSAICAHCLVESVLWAAPIIIILEWTTKNRLYTIQHEALGLSGFQFNYLCWPITCWACNCRASCPQRSRMFMRFVGRIFGVHRYYLINVMILDQKQLLSYSVVLLLPRVIVNL